MKIPHFEGKWPSKANYFSNSCKNLTFSKERTEVLHVYGQLLFQKVSMLCSLCFTTIWITVLLPYAITTKVKSGLSTNEALNRVQITASRIIACEYQNMSGMFKNEQAWQSGNTLEALANFVSLMDSPMKYALHQTFANTDIFTGGNCFDGYQWWLLAWLQAYSVQPDVNYLYRAADIFDYVAVNGWNDSVCRGGLQWCPNSTYKNAITNELFLLSSIRLHSYASQLDRPPTFYLDWALKIWQWFLTSGLINGDYLVNDGLRYAVSEKRIK